LEVQQGGAGDKKAKDGQNTPYGKKPPTSTEGQKGHGSKKSDQPEGRKPKEKKCATGQMSAYRSKEVMGLGSATGLEPDEGIAGMVRYKTDAQKQGKKKKKDALYLFADRPRLDPGVTLAFRLLAQCPSFIPPKSWVSRPSGIQGLECTDTVNGTTQYSDLPLTPVGQNSTFTPITSLPFDNSQLWLFRRQNPLRGFLFFPTKEGAFYENP
jgi:hypothetical protein